MPSNLIRQSRQIATGRHPSQPLLVVSVAVYLLLLAFRSFHYFKHLDVLLLLVQYGVILGVLVWYLQSNRSGLEKQERGLAKLGGLPRLNLLAIIGCFVILAIPLSWFSTRGLLNPDESGYSFQARIFKSSLLMADPLVGAASNVQETPAELSYTSHILRPFGWFAKFPPGWPLVLSLGYLISANWLPTGILGSFQLFIISVIGSQRFSGEVGTIGVLLAALSPFYLVNSVGMMSHALCGLLTAMACMALFKGLSSGSLGYFVAMFACLAATFQVRPYTAFVVTTVMTAAALWSVSSRRKLLVRVLTVGILFGLLAIAGVLAYNHAYTGHWLVSPYAQYSGADIPRELSLNPSSVGHAMAENGPFMIQETILGAFPFLHILAVYAVIREKQYRREVWILACLYLALVLAYLLHSKGYAVFFGERFHFEAFFAVVLLAARGMQLLVECWQIRRKAVIFALGVLAALQIAHLGTAAHAISTRGEPYRKIRAALESPNVAGLVFLHDSPGFVAMHYNLNEVDWRHARRIYLIDADPDRRAEWACLYGFSGWVVASYDPHTRAAALSSEHTTCPAKVDP